jgi:hypothetical protein
LLIHNSKANNKNKKIPKKSKWGNEQTNTNKKRTSKQTNKQTNQKFQIQEQKNFSLSLISGITPPASNPSVGV